MKLFKRLHVKALRFFKTKPIVQSAPQIPKPPIKPYEPPRPSPSDKGQNYEWCPFAVVKPEYQMPTKGTYRDGYPKGAVIHFTAGSSAESSILWGKGQGFAFWMIAKDGTIYQNKSLRRWGSHAGQSSWQGIVGTVSDELDGIEIDCAGRLEKRGTNWQSWFGRVVPPSLRRYSKGQDNIKEGWYEIFTEKQEESLIRLLLWLKSNNPKVFSLDLVLGHDEVSPDRKNDPGASLSMTMPKFREFLKKQYNG
jgi:N-acetyl-anhydromuramyl-L-alanine amidase AmpD